MKKSVKKIVSLLSFAIFTLALTFNVQATLDNPFNFVSDSAFAMVLSSGGSGGSGGGSTLGHNCLPGAVYEVYCYNGGCGASQCSIDAGISIAGYGISAAGSVTAEDGYFACCSLQCKPYSISKYKEKTSPF